MAVLRRIIIRSDESGRDTIQQLRNFYGENKEKTDGRNGMIW